SRSWTSAESPPRERLRPFASNPVKPPWTACSPRSRATSSKTKGGFMRSAPYASSLAASAELLRPGVTRVTVLGGTTAMVISELRRVRRDYLDICTRAAQPLLWLLVFGTALSNVRRLGSPGVEYRA